MAMTEKEVFFALLKNRTPPTNLKEICEKSGLSYSKIYKRLERSTLCEMPNMEMRTLCRTLEVSVDDLLELLTKAADGEFPDDYSKDMITLSHADWNSIDDRTIVARISKKEEMILMVLRASSVDAIDAVISALEEN